MLKNVGYVFVGSNSRQYKWIHMLDLFLTSYLRREAIEVMLR